MTLESFPFTTCRTAQKTQSFHWEVIEALQQQPKPSQGEIPEPCSPGLVLSSATSCSPKGSPASARGAVTWVLAGEGAPDARSPEDAALPAATGPAVPGLFPLGLVINICFSF